MNSVVLIGLPGCGKSTVGRLAARQAGWEFIDMDAAIEQELETSISALFATQGEEAFRRRETDMCRRLATKSRTVISCGGGVVLREENMRELRAGNTVVFLDRPVDSIAQGVATAHRPLLAQGAERVFRLAEERGPLYHRYADIVLPNTGSRQEAVAALTAVLQRPEHALRLAVIGDPIEHSLSPAIHLPVLEPLCRSVSYQKIRVPRGELAAFVRQAKEQGLDGFNLTMPHKIDILPLLDEIDPAAQAIGAVNTVAIREGRLIGYNTDADGFYTALAEAGACPQGARAVLIGAGGAAGALAIRGAQRGFAQLNVVGRTVPKAEQTAARAAEAAPGLTTQVFPFTPEGLAAACAGAAWLIHATPRGMSGMNGPDDQWQDLSFLEALSPEAVVCDLIYRPAQTALLQEAARRGHPVHNGLDMLIYQGILADEIYWGGPLDRPHMAQLVRRSLQEKGEVL